MAKQTKNLTSTSKTRQKAIKNKETEEKNKGGRPSKFTEEVVRKLEEAFRCAWSDTDACAYAGISRETFYDWMNENRRFSDNFTQEMQEDFISRINAAKVFPKIWCKKTLVQSGMRGDWRAALEYLKRTDTDYKDKSETTVTSFAFTWIEIGDATGETS